MAFTPEQYATIKQSWEDPNISYQDKIGAMQKYGVDVNAIAQATGVDRDVIGNTLMANGAERGFGGYSPGITDTYAGTYKTPSQVQAEAQAAAAERSRGVTVGGGSNSGGYATGAGGGVMYGGGVQPAPQQNLGMGGQQGYTKNPYLDHMASGITSHMYDNWTRNQLPSIRSGAMAAGGFGGSRQGVVEANGLNDMNRSLGANLANLYGSDYNNATGRNLQQQSINNSYDLGLRNSDLGFGQLDANINQQNFNNNLAGANFGMGVYGMMNGMNQQGINSGTQMQNTPLNYFNQFNGNTNATGGMGGTQTGTQGTTSNGLLQGLGLGMAGGDFLTKYFTAV